MYDNDSDDADNADDNDDIKELAVFPVLKTLVDHTVENCLHWNGVYIIKMGFYFNYKHCISFITSLNAIDNENDYQHYF